MRCRKKCYRILWDYFYLLYMLERLPTFTEISCYIFIKKRLILINLKKIRKNKSVIKNTPYRKYAIISLYEIIIFYRYS